MLKSANFISCVCSSKSVFICFSLPPAVVCYFLNFCTTREMPTRLSVRINNGVHATSRTAKPTKPRHLWVLFHRVTEMITQDRRPLDTEGIGRSQITEMMADDGQIWKEPATLKAEMFEDSHQMSSERVYLRRQLRRWLIDLSSITEIIDEGTNQRDDWR